MQNELLAGIEQSGCGRERDHVAHHHVRHRSLGRVQQHTADGQHALETILAIDDVEVDDPAPDLLLLNLRDSLAQGVVNQDLDEIRAGVVQRTFIEPIQRVRGGHLHPPANCPTSRHRLQLPHCVTRTWAGPRPSGNRSQAFDCESMNRRISNKEPQNVERNENFTGLSSLRRSEFLVGHSAVQGHRVLHFP